MANLAKSFVYKISDKNIVPLYDLRQ